MIEIDLPKISKEKIEEKIKWYLMWHPTKGELLKELIPPSLMLQEVARIHAGEFSSTYMCTDVFSYREPTRRRNGRIRTRDLHDEFLGSFTWYYLKNDKDIVKAATDLVGFAAISSAIEKEIESTRF